MVAFEKDDGFPAAGLEARVDALGFRADFPEQILVAVNVGAAGRTDLEKSKAALVIRVQLEKELDGAEALENALGIVHTVDAYAKQRGANVQLVTQGGHFFVHGAMRPQRIAVFLKSHTDGIRTHASQVALSIDGEAAPFGERFDGAIDGRKKVVAVRLDMKAD